MEQHKYCICALELTACYNFSSQGKHFMYSLLGANSNSATHWSACFRLNKGKYRNVRRKKLPFIYRFWNKPIHLSVSDLLGRMQWKWCLGSSTRQQRLSRQCCRGNCCALHPRTLSLQKNLSYLSWVLITTSGNTTMWQICFKIFNTK